MSKNDQILRKLMLAQENPDLNIGFDTKDLAALVITVMKAVRDIEGAIKNGRLDGKTPVAGKDYPTKAEISKALAEYVSKTDKDVTGKLTALEQAVKDKIETLTNGNDGVDGKDAEVTTEHIRQAAEIASGMIELPDIDLLVDTAIKSGGESIVDAINLLPEGDGVEMEKVKGLVSALNEITQRVSQIPRGQGGTIGTNVINKVINERIADGSIGGTIDTLGEIGDVSDTAATANQVLTWNAVSEEWEPATPPGASGGEANTASNLGTGEGVFGTKVGVDLRFKSLVGGTGVTLSADANEITIDRDAIAASDVTDFDTEVANNSAVTANTAKITNATHTGDVTGATALTIANGAVTAAKTSAGVQTSLGLADTATQPGDNISTLTNDSGFTDNSGDVVGPASAVNNAFVQFDTTTGKLIKESAITKISTDLTIISALDDEIATTKAIKAYTNAFTDADESKLDGIEASADVTDTANVTAAGALMDSEVTNLAQVKAFDSSDYATASHTHLLAAGATDVTATAAEVNILDGVTATTAEINFVDGVTSNVQTQLNAKAPTASPTLTGTTTTDALVYDTAAGTVSALGNLGATEVIDWSSATHFTGTLDSNITITHSNETAGQKITLAFIYDGTAQRTVTWTDVDKWATGTAPDAPSAAGEELVVTLIRLGTTVYGSYETFS